MKRFLCVAVVLVFIPLISFADFPDISGLSYDELVQLKDQINLAIWNSNEWQEVTVPGGTWKIGEDIPAGHWSIRLAAKHDYAYIYYFEEPDEFGKPYARGTKHLYQAIATEDWNVFENEYIHSYDIDMKDGWYFYCEKSTIFTPYAGKPDLGFK